MIPVEPTALVLLAGSVLLVLALVVRRSFLAWQERRRDALVARLRAAALALVDGDAAKPPPELRGAEQEVFAALLNGYARRLSGDARARIADYFETSGGVDEQLTRLGSRRAWRRATAAFALGDMCSSRASPDLLRALGDRRREVRMAATRSLGRLGALDAVEPLIHEALAGRVPRDVTGV